MSDFIFDYEIEKIKNVSTRKYLSEVLSSYYNGNYRAAIVSLYSIVIFDLLHKVIQLREIYNSEEAKEILDHIENMHQNDELSAKWENDLICRVTVHIKKTKNSVGNEHDSSKKYLTLLDSFAYGKFFRLKTDRHKCAHPTHDENYFLRNFNKDETRAHIRNMIECIFLKDVVLGNDVCKMIENDIGNLKSVFAVDEVFSTEEKEKVKKYFSHKYFKKLNDTGKKQVFKFLWNKTMCLDCNGDLVFHYFVLTSLVDENFDLLKNYFAEDIYFLKDIYTEDNIYISEYLEPSPVLTNCSFALISCFFAEYKSFFAFLTEELKTKISIISKKYLNYYLLAYYQHLDLREHLIKVDENYKIILNNRVNKDWDLRYDNNVLLKLYDLSKNMKASDVKLVRKFIIKYSLKALSYSFCTNVLEGLILQLLPDFDDEDFLELFDGMNSDNQFYGMGTSSYNPNKYHKIEHYIKKIRTKSDEVLGEDFDYSQYDNLA